MPHRKCAASDAASPRALPVHLKGGGPAVGELAALVVYPLACTGGALELVELRSRILAARRKRPCTRVAPALLLVYFLAASAASAACLAAFSAAFFASASAFAFAAASALALFFSARVVPSFFRFSASSASWVRGTVGRGGEGRHEEWRCSCGGVVGGGGVGGMGVPVGWWVVMLSPTDRRRPWQLSGSPG